MHKCGCCIGAVLIVVTLLLNDYLNWETDRWRLDCLTLQTVGVLREAGIEHWATGGTLFGAHLDKRTPHADFDADLSVLIVDAVKVRNLPWRRHGLVAYEGFGGFRIKAHARDTIRVDIIIIYNDKQCNCLRFAWSPLETFPFSYPLVPSEFIFPLQQVNFAHGTVSIPNRTHEMLQWQYGAYKQTAPAGFHQLLTSTAEKKIWTALIMPHIHWISPVMPY
jgi:hypothetical protein